MGERIAVAKECTICGRSNTQVRWLRIQSCTIDNVTYKLPIEDFCFVCGTTMDVWPLQGDTPEGRQKLARRYH